MQSVPLKYQKKGMNMTAKTIYSGTTHNVGGANGYTRSADGFLDLQFADPHPAAENFFGAAWSGCFMGAIGLAAAEEGHVAAGPLCRRDDRPVDGRWRVLPPRQARRHRSGHRSP